MLGRIAFVALWTLATLSPQTPSAQTSPAPVISTAKTIRWELAGDLQVTLMDQKSFLLVDVAGQSVPVFKGAVPQRPPIEGLQVWVRRNDGTAVRLRTALLASEWASTGGGWGTKSWELTFEYAPFRELAGIAVRAKGQTYVRDMPRPK